MCCRPSCQTARAVHKTTLRIERGAPRSTETSDAVQRAGLTAFCCIESRAIGGDNSIEPACSSIERSMCRSD